METSHIAAELRDVKRMVIAWSTCLAGVALLLWMWSHRFEVIEERSVWTLQDLKFHLPPTPGIEWKSNPDGPVLRVSLSPNIPRVVALLPLNGLGPTECIHSKVKLRSDALHPGNNPWEDGRILLEWHSENGEISHDSLGSCQEDIASDSNGLVIRSEIGSASPTLRIEHIGRSGAYEVSELEITAVRERLSWSYGKWLLGALLITGLTLLLRCYQPRAPIWASIVSALIWITLGAHFVVPGPWKDQRPLLMPFSFSKTSLAAPPTPPNSGTLSFVRDPSEKTSMTSPSTIEPIGKLPDKGSLILRIKLQLQEAREFLHAMLLAGPALILALLVGRKPALLLCVALSLLIELAQYAFGYGSDLTDLADLACDGIGICSGLIVHQYLVSKHWIPKFLLNPN